MKELTGIWGVGPKTAEELIEAGLHTVEDVRRLGRHKLNRHQLVGLDRSDLSTVLGQSDDDDDDDDDDDHKDVQGGRLENLECAIVVVIDVELMQFSTHENISARLWFDHATASLHMRTIITSTRH